MESDSNVQTIYAEPPTGSNDQVLEFSTCCGGKIKVVNCPRYVTQNADEKKTALLEALDSKQCEIESLYKRHRELQATRQDMRRSLALDTSQFEIKRNKALFLAIRRDFIDAKLAYAQKKLNGDVSDSKEDARMKACFQDLATRITTQDKELKKQTKEKRTLDNDAVALEAKLEEMLGQYSRAVYKNKHAKLVIDRMQIRNQLLAAECKRLSKDRDGLHKSHFRF